MVFFLPRLLCACVPSFKSRASLQLLLLTSVFLTGCKGTLTVEPAENGLVSSTDGFISCGEQCSYEYDANTEVELSAQAQDDYQFINWTGACTGAESSCLVVVSGNKTVGAVFLQSDDPGIGSPISVTAGEEFSLSYSGSTDDRDEIGIYVTDAENGDDLGSVYLPDQAGTVSIRAPREPGTYELRMINDKRETIVIDGSVIVEPYDATITPGTNQTTPTRRISVAYTGSTHRTDRLGIFIPGAANRRYEKSTTLFDDAGTVEIEVPATEGMYEFRMVSNDGVLISQGGSLELAYGDASVSGPEIAFPEEVVSISYSGSTETRDRIALYGQLGGGYVSSGNADQESGEMLLTMPEETGIFDLKLINSGREIIASGDYISVLDAEKAEVFPAPEMALVNQDITVAYSGANPLADDVDRLGIYEQSADNAYPLSDVLVPEAQGVGTDSLVAPPLSGIYEVRLVTAANETRAMHLLNVFDLQDTFVYAPQQIVAGDTVNVIFNDPSGNAARVALYQAGEENNRSYVVSKSLPDGAGFVEMRVPTAPGDYEIRLLNSSYEIIAQGNAVEIMPYNASATLSKVFTTPADTIRVNYTGSTDRNDRLGFYIPGEPNNEYVRRVTLSEDEGEIEVLVPGEEGVYEVRMINSFNETILDLGSITLSYGQLALSAPAIAYPGESIPVTYEGSTELRDRIVLEYLESTRAARGVYTDGVSSGVINMDAPADTGIYELKLLNPTGAVITTGGFVSVLDSAEKRIFIAPETTQPGQTVTIAYSGSEGTAELPESVGIYRIGAPDSEPLVDAVLPPQVNGILNLSAPSQAGVYEARLLNADGTSAAHSEYLKLVDPSETAVYVPDVVSAGDTMPAVFSGSLSSSDRVILVPVAEDSPRNYVSAATARESDGWVSLRAPTIPGEYRVMLVQSDYTALAEGHTFTVLPYNASVTIASSATPSESVSFTYSGSTHRSDFLGIYPEDGSLDDRLVSRTLSDDSGESTITMPSVEGFYSVRMVNSEKEIILDVGVIQVAYITNITVSAPPFAAPGESFAVDYEGSTQTSDQVVLKTTLNPSDIDIVESERTRGEPAGTLTLEAPLLPGIYGLEMLNPGRVQMADGGFVSVLDPADTAVFAAPAIANPGSDVLVAFSGVDVSGNTVGIYDQLSSNDNPIVETAISSPESMGADTLPGPLGGGIYDVRLLDDIRVDMTDPAFLYVLDPEATEVHSQAVAVAGETVAVLFSSTDIVPDKVAFYPVGSELQEDAISPTRVDGMSGAAAIRVPTIEGQYVIRMLNREYDVIASGREITILPYDGDIDP